MCCNGGVEKIIAMFEFRLRDDTGKEFVQQLMELFDAAKIDDATVQTLHDRFAGTSGNVLLTCNLSLTHTLPQSTESL